MEIPDTPVVNFTHAGATPEQDLLKAAAEFSTRMWNTEEMSVWLKKELPAACQRPTESCPLWEWVMLWWEI